MRILPAQRELFVRSTERLLAASFVMALAAYSYVGFFTRYMADDYTTRRTVDLLGLLGAQTHWYFGWTGRFSFSFVISLLGLTGPRVVQFLPALLLASWCAATVWAVHQLRRLGSLKPSYTESLLFAALVIFATIETAPNVAQSLYWQTGALTYITPLVLLSFYAGLFGHGLRRAESKGVRPSVLSLCGSAAVTFVAGGFSDAYVVLQTSGLLIAFAACERYAHAGLKSAMRALLLAGLVGSLLALAVVVLAPGNAIRQSYFPHPPGMFRILGLSSLYSLAFAARAVFKHPLVFALLLLLPFLTAFKDSARRDAPDEGGRRRAGLFVLVPFIVFALEVCCIAPAFYGMSVMLPERARVLLSFTLVCGAVVWGCAAGEFCLDAWPFVGRNTERVVRAGSFLLLALMFICPVASCISTFTLRERARAYAADWDRQDEELRAAKEGGVRELTVEQIGDFQSRLGLGRSDLHLRADPNFWINKTVAKYYGLDSVAAREDAVGLP